MAIPRSHRLGSSLNKGKPTGCSKPALSIPHRISIFFLNLVRISGTTSTYPNCYLEQSSTVRGARLPPASITIHPWLSRSAFTCATGCRRGLRTPFCRQQRLVSTNVLHSKGTEPARRIGHHFIGQLRPFSPLQWFHTRCSGAPFFVFALLPTPRASTKIEFLFFFGENIYVFICLFILYVTVKSVFRPASDQTNLKTPVTIPRFVRPSFFS